MEYNNKIKKKGSTTIDKNTLNEDEMVVTQCDRCELIKRDVFPIIEELKVKLKNNLIAAYGIGSFFDSSLPNEFKKGDVDIIAVVQSLKKLPKQDWTEARFETKDIKGIPAIIHYNALELYQSKEAFEKYSWSNYEWSVVELKNDKNSLFLYGQDIRDQLPDIKHYDYDGILKRALFHLDKSFRHCLPPKDEFEAQREFSKGVFKFSFYLCAYFNKDFQLTSITHIARKLETLITECKVNEGFFDNFKKSLAYRKNGSFGPDFERIRLEFLLGVFSALSTGKLHKKLKYNDLQDYLKNSFKGLRNLVSLAEKLKDSYYRKKQ